MTRTTFFSSTAIFLASALAAFMYATRPVQNVSVASANMTDIAMQPVLFKPVKLYHDRIEETGDEVVAQKAVEPCHDGRIEYRGKCYTKRNLRLVKK